MMMAYCIKYVNLIWELKLPALNRKKEQIYETNTSERISYQELYFCIILRIINLSKTRGKKVHKFEMLLKKNE